MLVFVEFFRFFSLIIERSFFGLWYFRRQRICFRTFAFTWNTARTFSSFLETLNTAFNRQYVLLQLSNIPDVASFLVFYWPMTEPGDWAWVLPLLGFGTFCRRFLFGCHMHDSVKALLSCTLGFHTSECLVWGHPLWQDWIVPAFLGLSLEAVVLHRGPAW